MRSEARGPAGVGEALKQWTTSGQSENEFVQRLHEAFARVSQQQSPGKDKWLIYLEALRENR